MAFKSLQTQGICWKNTVSLSTAFKGNSYYDPVMTVVMCIWQDVKNMLRNAILCTWNLLVHFIQGLRSSHCDLCGNILGSFGAPDVSSLVHYFASLGSKAVLSYTKMFFKREQARENVSNMWPFNLLILSVPVFCSESTGADISCQRSSSWMPLLWDYINIASIVSL